MAFPRRGSNLKRVYLAAYMADVSTASSAFIQSPVRGVIKKVRGELFSAITGTNSAVTVEVNNVAQTALGTMTITQSGSAAGDSFETPAAGLENNSYAGTAAGRVNVGDAIEMVSDGASSTAAPMNFTIEIQCD